MKLKQIALIAITALTASTASAAEVVYLGPNKVATVRCDNGSYASATGSIERALSNCGASVTAASNPEVAFLGSDHSATVRCGNGSFVTATSIEGAASKCGNK